MMSGGGTAVLAVYPDDGVAVAVMANLGQAKLPFRPFINVVPSDVTPSGILISPQWAWEDLNFRPHPYQAFEFRRKSRHFAVIFTMDHMICRHLDPKCRTLPASIDTMPTFRRISRSRKHHAEDDAQPRG